MSPRTRTGGVGVAVVVSVLVVLGGAGSAVALSPASPTLSLQDRSAPPTPLHDAHEHAHEHAHGDEHGTTPQGHEHQAPSGEHGDADEHGDHGDHGSTPPDDVSTATRTLVLGGFGILNAGVLAAASLVRRRSRRAPPAGRTAGRSGRPGPRP